MRLHSAQVRLFAVAMVVAAVPVGASAGRTAAGVTTVTVAGASVSGVARDGAQATETTVDQPYGVAATPDGGFVWAEPSTHSVRAVGRDGIVKRIAGDGRPGTGGDGGPAIRARLNLVSAVAPTSGGFLLADTSNDRIRLVDRGGVITTRAGTGLAGFAGDGGPATAARLRNPRGVAPLPGGGFLIADTGNHRVRRVGPDGTITTVAGNGVRGYSGDSGKAEAARLASPSGVATTPDGSFLIVDSGNQRIRKVGPGGTITTVAGTGTAGFGGDGGPATSAPLSGPRGVVALPDGGFLIADTDNHRVRRVAPDGSIATYAGTGSAGSAGDGGPALQAQIAGPTSVDVTPGGAVLIAEYQGNRIRFVGTPSAPASVPPRPAIFGDARVGATVNAFAGGWKGTGPTVRYRWLRCNLTGGDCRPIPGAEGRGYRARGADLGSALRVRVTARNVAGTATATSPPAVVGRLVRTTFSSGRDSVAIRGIFEASSEPRLVYEAGQSVAVVRRRLSTSKWDTSVGFLRFDTSSFPKRKTIESVVLRLRITSARSDDRGQLVVHTCQGTWPIDKGDFTAKVPRGGVARIAIAKLRRGARSIPLPPSAISSKGATELCLYVSGRVPRGVNVLSFWASPQLALFSRVR